MHNNGRNFGTYNRTRFRSRNCKTILAESVKGKTILAESVKCKTHLSKSGKCKTPSVNLPEKWNRPRIDMWE